MTALRHWRSLLVLAIVFAAVAVCRATPVGRHLGPNALDELAGTAWAAPVLVGLYIVTFALAIPGSALFIAAGFVFTPPLATALGIVGGTLGSLAAHGVGRVLGGEARERWQARRGFAILAQSLDFTGLLTLRLLPAFPHSLVNYGSGIAGARLSAFLPATVIGLGVKSYVYASIAYRASRANEPLDLLRPEVVGVLLGLALLSLLAKLMVRRRAGAARVGGSTPA